MRILIYGAGPLGSLFAQQLHAAGHDVAILARGQRLADIREHGVVIHNITTDETVVAPVRAVEALAPDDAYDLVLVIMRKNAALTILPVLAANHHTPNVLFLMNNAAGPGELIEALGRERVLTGFPVSAGYRDGPTMHCITGTAKEKARIPFSEIDGTVTARVREIAGMLASTPWLEAEIRGDMDAWLKYHVAMLMPSVAAALYACDTDIKRLARTRDALVLAIRAVREGFAVLRELGYPITPGKLALFTLLPEPLIVLILQKVLVREEMEVALAKHAHAARDEVLHLTDEFLALAAKTHVETPAILRLYPYFDPAHPPLPDGSRAIPLDWRAVRTAVALLLGLIVLHRLSRRRERSRTR